MIRKHRRDWRFGMGLVAAIAFSAVTAMPATALDSWALDNSGCQLRSAFSIDGIVTKGEARALVRHYLGQLGFSASSRSVSRALVSGVEADGDKWRVSFKYGGHFPTNRAVIFIDRNTGLIGSSALAANARQGLVVG